MKTHISNMKDYLAQDVLVNGCFGNFEVINVEEGKVEYRLWGRKKDGV